MKKTLLLLTLFAALAATAQTNTTIVDHNQATGQTTDSGQFILSGASGTGDYRVSVYLVGSSTTKQITPFVIWHDENGVQETGQSGGVPALPPLATGDNFAFDTVELHNVATNSVQAQACVGTGTSQNACTNSTTGGSYDVFVVVEQLF